MEVYEYTNPGIRDYNQDYLTHKILGDGIGIFVVADGMGGYSQGDVASRLVADSIVEYVENNYQSEQPASMLRQAISYANESLMFKRVANGGEKMGTVIVVLFLLKDQAYISWLGDSRAYLFRDDIEVYHTEDHSMVNVMLKIDSLKLSADALEKYSHIVTKAVMGDDKLREIPVSRIQTVNKDIFVLCTDGFHKEGNAGMVVRYSPELKDEFDSECSKYSDNNSFMRISLSSDAIMSFPCFVEKISNLSSFYSVKGVEYKLSEVTPTVINGIRVARDTHFKIPTKALYKAYCDLRSAKEPITTSALKQYVFRVQSPAVAILMAL